MKFKRENILNQLHQGICIATFTKKNGEERVMSCTLNESLLPAEDYKQNSESKKKKNEDVVSVWDLESKGWRSFRLDSLKKFHVSSSVKETT